MIRLLWHKLHTPIHYKLHEPYTHVYTCIYMYISFIWWVLYMYVHVYIYLQVFPELMRPSTSDRSYTGSSFRPTICTSWRASSRIRSRALLFSRSNTLHVAITPHQQFHWTWEKVIVQSKFIQISWQLYQQFHWTTKKIDHCSKQQICTKVYELGIYCI